MNIPSASIIWFYNISSLENRGALRHSCYADTQFEIRVWGARASDSLVILQRPIQSWETAHRDPGNISLLNSGRKRLRKNIPFAYKQAPMQMRYLLNTTGSKMGMREWCQRKSSKSEENQEQFSTQV